MSTQEAIRQRITDEIVAALKAGTPPWRRPWVNGENSGSPTNVVSKRAYSGVNPLLLQLAAQQRGWNSRWWGTFRQWESLGFQIVKRPADVLPGRWGTKIVFCKPVCKSKKINANGEDEESRFFLLREFTVFNAEQVTGPGIEQYHVQPRQRTDFVDCGAAEQVIGATQADIRYGGDRAFYRSSEDFIQIPVKQAFVTEHEFYATCLHELAHWSGHASRLARLSETTRYGDAAYAFEELVAEIGGCFLATEVGVPQSDDLSNQHASLNPWLAALENDHRAIFKASQQASKAADLILSFSRRTEEESCCQEAGDLQGAST